METFGKWKKLSILNGSTRVLRCFPNHRLYLLSTASMAGTSVRYLESSLTKDVLFQVIRLCGIIRLRHSVCRIANTLHPTYRIRGRNKDLGDSHMTNCPYCNSEIQSGWKACPVCCQDNQMDAECLVVIAVSTVVTFQSHLHHRLIPICEGELWTSTSLYRF